jgi:hypothetical protein
MFHPMFQFALHNFSIEVHFKCPQLRFECRENVVSQPPLLPISGNKYHKWENVRNDIVAQNVWSDQLSPNNVPSITLALTNSFPSLSHYSERQEAFIWLNILIMLHNRVACSKMWKILVRFGCFVHNMNIQYYNVDIHTDRNNFNASFDSYFVHSICCRNLIQTYENIRTTNFRE